MSNDFYRVSVVNQLDEFGPSANLIIQSDDPSKRDAYSELNEKGAYNLPMEQPTNDDRHIALGKFMDAWSKVEMAMSTLIEHLLETDARNLPVLMNSLGTRGQLDVINVLAEAAFDEAAINDLASILARIRTNSTRRNNIVHGFWLLEILVRNHGGKPALIYQQWRAYDPGNPAECEAAARRDPKVRTKYYYSLSRLNSLSNELHRIWNDLTQFSKKQFKISD